MNTNSSKSTKTDAAGRAGSTNAGPPKYDTRPPAPITASGGSSAQGKGLASPTFAPIPRDHRPNSGGN